MAKLTKFELTELPELLVVGKRITDYNEPMDVLKKLWDRCADDGVFQTLEEQDGYVYDSSMVGFRYGDTDAEYIVGLLMRPGALVPEGFSSFLIGPVKTAICWVKGKGLFDVISNASKLMGKALEKRVFEREKTEIRPGGWNSMTRNGFFRMRRK